MNKIYDKLLLVISLLILGAGVAVYYSSSNTAPTKPDAIQAPSGGAYQVVPVPELSINNASWPEASEQPSGWVYDVFTPPKIYIDRHGDFTIEAPYDDTLPPPPFGLYLASMERQLYRIQLEGYIEEDVSDVSKTLLLFYDIEKRRSLRARPGDKVDRSDFEVLSFEVERLTGADGSITKLAKATILDKRTAKEAVLRPEERLYEEGVDIVLRSREDPTIEYRPTIAGESFVTSLGNYVLDDIDLDNQEVTVTKLANSDFDAETQVLALKLSSAEQETSTELEGGINDAVSSNELDGLFE